MEQISICAKEDLPGLIDVQQDRAHAVNVAVAVGDNAVIEHQPAFGRLDGNRPGADFGGLPPLPARPHHEAVPPPVNHVRALADVDIAERRVAVVAGTAEHQEVAIELAREQHSVAIERKESVFQLFEGLEVLCLRDSNRRTVVIIAPRYVVGVVDQADPGIVGIGTPANFRVAAGNLDLYRLDLPVKCVFASSEVKPRHGVRVFDAEHSNELTLVIDDRAVVYALRSGERPAPYQWVATVSPDNVRAVRRLIFPGDVRHRLAEDCLAHSVFSLALETGQRQILARAGK